MTNIIWGSWAEPDQGWIGQLEGPVSSVGDNNTDAAVGAFTTTSDLPATIDSPQAFLDFAAAMGAKASDVYDGGISVTGITARGFFGYGGGGDDIFEVHNSASGSLYGRGGDDRLSAFSADDTLDGGDGDDTLHGGLGDNVIIGGLGFDWADYADAPSAINARLYDGFVTRTVETDFDSVPQVDGVIGTGFGDELSGNDGRNGMRGGGGGDQIRGLGGADSLDGGLDADRIEGGDGADQLAGGEGDDTLDGGLDSDTADYRGAGAAVSVDLTLVGAQATGGAGADDLRSIENLFGSQYRDLLAGNGEDNHLDGRGGRDRLAGGDGDDGLVGAGGTDVLIGGLGADTMTGGPGKDRYFYSSVSESPKGGGDLITDLSGDDRVYLTDIDANETKAGNQAFDLVAALTGKAGQAELRYDAPADQTRLLLDVDGDGKADASIVFAGDHRDFVNFAL